ncbi:type II secretion system protein [Bacillus massilinigeriensis]|uniref:type II secretion system protein n=1 Tax=Bacillus massilionigeriensis TaxID=1805475 RepID=UPI00096B4EA7|nr:prepilin-type N-terminal cleavage/methylation domain-containing protein [Bacillus massilionigeriensis]
MLQNIKRRLKNQKGFTLVELLAVIVILGIIAAIAIPSIGGIIQKSKEDAVKADAIQIINAAKTYVASEGIPESSGTIDPENIEMLVEKGSVTVTGITATFDSDTNRTVITITGEGKAGKETINFKGATLDDIKNDKGKGSRDIPASATPSE